MILMSIKSGSYMLGVVPVITGGYAVELHHEEDGRRETIFKQDRPVSVWLKTANGEELLVSVPYRDSAWKRGKLLLAGEARSGGGTVIRVEDVYEAGEEEGEGEGIFQMSRQVTVVEAGSDAEGFTSQFGMESALGGSLSDYEMFAPGVWYRGNENVVKTAIASDYSRPDIHMREMRLALPFLLMRDPHTGYSLSVGRANASSSSDADETSPDWLVDESMQYGSFGIRTGVLPSLQFRYPGWEGDTNYIDRSVPWIRRSHPVRPGLSHDYRLLLRIERKSQDYAEAMRGAWRFFYEAARPEIKRLDLSAVYGNAVCLLDHYCQNYNGVLGLPFKAQLPTGEVTGHAMVMGFVGQQLPAAYQMIRHGYLRDEPSLIRKGIDIVDFWVQRSLTPAGLPKTWYEPFFEGTGNFTNGSVDLRTMSDGMEGALDAYLLMKRHGAERADWLRYIARFGDWLAASQNDDGSYCRLYGLDGKPVHPGKHNTTNPVRFLLRLHDATGLQVYRDAALRAGNYAYEQVYERFHYFGGTSDNDNTIDKEAGAMAMNAFLALYEHTDEEKWLGAFQGAADFTETWMFAWDYNLRQGGTRWEARDAFLPQWIMVDLEKTEIVQAVQVPFYPDNSMYEYHMETSMDRLHWVAFVPNAEARYVRVTITGMNEMADMRVSVWSLDVLGADERNFALKKPASASSWRNEMFHADKAVDGRGPDYRSPIAEGLIGRSIVATGHTYADMYMAYKSSQFYRLYLFTGDSHYLHVALLLQHNVNRLTDWDGTKGYSHPGLIEEGAGVAEFVYRPIDVWLTWCTVAQLEPLSELEDRFGTYSIDRIEELPLQQRITRNRFRNF